MSRLTDEIVNEFTRTTTCSCCHGMGEVRIWQRCPVCYSHEVHHTIENTGEYLQWCGTCHLSLLSPEAWRAVSQRNNQAREETS